MLNWACADQAKIACEETDVCWQLTRSLIEVCKRIEVIGLWTCRTIGLWSYDMGIMAELG